MQIKIGCPCIPIDQKKTLKFDNVKWWQGCRDERALMLGSVDAGELPGTTYHIKKMQSQQLKNQFKLKKKKRKKPTVLLSGYPSIPGNLPPSSSKDMSEVVHRCSLVMVSRWKEVRDPVPARADGRAVGDADQEGQCSSEKQRAR